MKRLFPILCAVLLALTACAPTAAPASPAPSGAPLPTASSAPGTSLPPETPAPAEGGVHTDWSRLEPRKAPLPAVGTRWYEDYTDALPPGDDYGLLIPYAGLRLMDDWPAYTGCVYGLMTAEGAVVVDPVFGSVSRASYYDGGYRRLSLLLLSKGDPALEDAWDPARVAVAAADGSWCTGFDYRCARASREGLLLFTEDSLSLMTPEGEIRNRYSPADLEITQEEFDGLLSDASWGEGVGGEWCGDYLTLAWADEGANSVWLYRISAGEKILMSYEDWQAYRSEREPAPSEDPREAERQAILDSMLADRAGQHCWGEWLQDELLGSDVPALMRLMTEEGETIRTAYYTEDGTRIPVLDDWSDEMGTRWYRQVRLVGGLVECLDWNTASYYDLNTQACVFRTCLGYEGE